MPFTYSIAQGITLGAISNVLIHKLNGKVKGIHPVMVVLAVELIAYHAFI